MNCPECGYALWNLPSRRCPECGLEFVPSQFEFVANSVAFCCPHCDQSYYGTGAQGHLVPSAFACVSCGNHIHMDQMVLRPTTGVSEEQTQVYRTPWLDRDKIGRWRGFWRTAGLALFNPRRLATSLPQDRENHQAWWFALHSFIYAFLPFIILAATISVAAMLSTGGRVGFVEALPACFILAAPLIGLVSILIFGAIAHLILVLTGRTQHGIERTFEAFCYASGVNVINLTCVGMYASWLWWLISTIIILQRTQKVGPARAIPAVLALPLLLFLGGMGLSVWGTVTTTRQVAAMNTARSTVSSSGSFALGPLGSVVSSVLNHASPRFDGAGPKHIALLIGKGGLRPTDLVSSETNTNIQSVQVGGKTLMDMFGPASEVKAIAQKAADALPAKVIAYRLGDYVFTYHGMDLNNVSSDLWIAIESPDPDQNRGSAYPVSVMTSTTNQVVTYDDRRSFLNELARQNRLRANHNLPPLPDPRTITHTRPAVPQTAEAEESELDT